MNSLGKKLPEKSITLSYNYMYNGTFVDIKGDFKILSLKKKLSIFYSFMQNEHLYGLLMDNKNVLLFYLEKDFIRGPNFKLFAYLEGLQIFFSLNC